MHKLLCRGLSWSRYSTYLLGGQFQRVICKDIHTDLHVCQEPAEGPRGSEAQHHIGLSWTTTNQLVEHLGKNIIHQDRNIIALDKPNGVPMHPLKYTEDLPIEVGPPESADLSVAGCLPGLSNVLGTPELYPVYSQSRLVSGVILLAKNKKTRSLLARFFQGTRSQKIFYQQFVSLTVGMPETASNDCQINLRREEINGWQLSVKVDERSKRARLRGKLICPSVKHNIVCRSLPTKTALISLWPTATKWDALQVYLISQMCAVLGDHVYSPRLVSVMNRTILRSPQSSYPAPQVLPNVTLKALGIKKQQTRHLPLHLHCHQVEVPLPGKKSSSTKKVIRAPLPEFFVHSMSCLGLEGNKYTSHTEESDLGGLL